MTAILLHQNKNNNTEVTKVNEEEPYETVAEDDKEIDAVEAFKVCITTVRRV